MKFADGIDEGDFYGLLDIPPTATVAEVRIAYRTQAKRWRPDQNKGRTEVTARMAAINRARDVLSNSVQRQVYDDALRQKPQPGRHRAPTKSQTPPKQAPDGQRPRPHRRGHDFGGAPPRSTAGTLASYFRARGGDVIDKRQKGGALWVVGGPELKGVMDALHQQGFNFEYAARGGRATEHKPAWWTESAG